MRVWAILGAALAAGCSGSAGPVGTEPAATVAAPLGPDGGEAGAAATDAGASDAPSTDGDCLQPRNSPFVDAGGGCLADGLMPIGHPCTPGQDDACEPSAYVGPLTLSWGCYLTPETTSDYRCAFRCDDVSGVPLVDVDAGPFPPCDPFKAADAQPLCSPTRFPADAQVSADQPASVPPICAQLGGQCAVDPSLPATNGRPGALFWGASSVCVVAP